MLEYIESFTLGEILKGIALAGAGLSLFVEIAPIRINPLSAFVRWFGQKMNQQLAEKLQEYGEKLDKVQESVDDNEVDRIRWEILDFANSCRNGRRHSEDEFDHIIALNEKYHKILKKRNQTNGKIELEYVYIVEIYRECQRNNSFL